MEKGFPKKIKSSKDIKKGDQVICVIKKPKSAYMEIGEVKWTGTIKKVSKIGVEFTKSVKSKDTVNDYKPKIKGSFCLFRAKEIYKCGKKSFDVDKFKKKIESKSKKSKGRSSKLVLPSKKKPTELSINEEDKTSVIVEEMKSSKKIDSDKKIKKKEKPKEEVFIIEEENDEDIGVNKITNGFNEDYERLKKDYNKIKDENSKNFIALKKVDVEKGNLLEKNNKIELELKDCKEKLEVLEENYENLKNQNVDDTQIDNVKILEEISELKLTNKKNSEIIKNLNENLEKYKDYEEIKINYEEKNLELINLKKDMENFETKGGDTNKIIAELREKIEIYELEAEIAINEPMPTNENDLKQNYKLIQTAFGKIQLDLDEQKDEYEILLLEMNEEIAFIKNKYKDSMDKKQIDELFLKKNEEIENLKKIIHEYSDLNKNSERLTKVNLEKDENIENLKKEILKQKEEIKTLEEIKQLLDDINLDLETNLENDNENINLLQKEIEDSNKQIENLQKDINKYKEKLQELKENNNLQIGASMINMGGGSLEKSNLYSGYNKSAASKQNEIKEILFFKNSRNENLFEFLEYNFYFDCLPDEMKNSLHLEKFYKVF